MVITMDVLMHCFVMLMVTTQQKCCPYIKYPATVLHNIFIDVFIVLKSISTPEN